MGQTAEIAPRQAGTSHRSLPRRDEAARHHLADVSVRAAPLILARDLTFEVVGALSECLPKLARGSVIEMSGTGKLAAAFSVAGGITSIGEWVAIVDPDSQVGALAAHQMGVALDQCAFIRHNSPEVLAALVDGTSCVVITDTRLTLNVARRLTARARERKTTIVSVGKWPADVTHRVHVDPEMWFGIAQGNGFISERKLGFQVSGRAIQSNQLPAVAG